MIEFDFESDTVKPPRHARGPSSRLTRALCRRGVSFATSLRTVVTLRIVPPLPNACRAGSPPAKVGQSTAATQPVDLALVEGGARRLRA